MKKLSVLNLRAGQVFTEPVYIEGNSLLVPAGIAIRKKDIDRLKSWGIDEVYTNGEALVSTPDQTEGAVKSALSKGHTDSSKPKNHILSLPDVHENKGAYRTYKGLIEGVGNLFTSISSGLSVETRSIDTIAGRLLQAVREQREQIMGFILGGEVEGFELAKSSVNTAILSTLIAIELRVPNHKILQITTGALLHDVGMLKLPKDIVEKKGGLSDAELQRIQAHPLYSYKIICKELLYPEEVGVVALQHHERWNGEGYPRRIAGEAIELGARIVCVADAFEAMVSEKPYRNSMIGYQAMKNLLSDNSRRFDPEVLKAFIKTMGIYPIGSIVLLNNGAIARVVEVHKDAPLRPQIRILVDEFGKTFNQDDGDLMDLLIERSLFIARAIDPKEFSKVP
jgi:HD-GYP domain-containing protein (c-di-GMP phosphodiesterase class II)